MHNNKVNYLITNQVGAFSRKVYGLKGDQVKIITHSINMRLVENQSGNRFWVNVNNLSEAPIKKDIVYDKADTNAKGKKTI